MARKEKKKKVADVIREFADVYEIVCETLGIKDDDGVIVYGDRDYTLLFHVSKKTKREPKGGRR